MKRLYTGWVSGFIFSRDAVVGVGAWAGAGGYGAQTCAGIENWLGMLCFRVFLILLLWCVLVWILFRLVGAGAFVLFFCLLCYYAFWHGT